MLEENQKEAIESGLTPAKLYDGSSIYVPTEEYMTGKAVQEAQKNTMPTE
ncbi:hypothetical protein NXW84_21555 [Bacteroides fragilis]|nr:hypothetical protein NXW84_21555 [Bacteroides fragilis]